MTNVAGHGLWRGGLAIGLALLSANAAAQGSADKRLAALEARVQRLDDRAAIENLTRAYGYYVDKQLWNEVVDTFSDDARVEIAGRGVYRGRQGVDRLFRLAMGGGKIGLRDGGLFNHMILQGVVNVAPDGQTAKGRWRAFVQIGQHKAFGLWSEGTYENEYVKRGGVWQIKDMHFYATYYTPYDQGWAKFTMPNNGPSKDHGPDEAQSVKYDVYPGHYVPPFHYPNPVTGRVWTKEDSAKYSTTGQSPAPAGPPVQPGMATQPMGQPPAAPSAAQKPAGQ